MVIFFTYNAFSEEKVKGTLKLTLSNSIPRDNLLLGKIIGGLIVIFVSLFIASIISLILMLVTPAVSNMIREDRAFQIPQIMQTTSSIGMRLMDDSLVELVKKKKITFEEALLRAEDKAKITRIELEKK